MWALFLKTFGYIIAVYSRSCIRVFGTYIFPTALAIDNNNMTVAAAATVPALSVKGRRAAAAASI